MPNDNRSDKSSASKSKAKSLMDSVTDRIACFSLGLSLRNPARPPPVDAHPHPPTQSRPHPTALRYENLGSDPGAPQPTSTSTSIWSTAFGTGRADQVPSYHPSEAARRPAHSKTWKCPPHVEMPRPIVSRPVPPAPPPASMPQPPPPPPPPVVFPFPVPVPAAPPASTPPVAPKPPVSAKNPAASRPQFASSTRPVSASTSVPPPPVPSAARPTDAPATPPVPRPRPPNSKATLLTTPTKPKKIVHLTSPQINTPGGLVTPNRCAGTTQNGKGCNRTKAGGTPSKKLKQSSLSLVVDGLETFEAFSGEEEQLPWFCYQHLDAGLRPPGYFVREKYINYSDWIAERLPNQTKLQLRTEMSKPVTLKDRKTRGYIYCHEMAPSPEQQESFNNQSRKRPPTTYIKIGRSVRPVARLGEWTRQCPSRDPIVRGFFFPEGGNGSLQAGQQQFNQQGLLYHHRWERLILIEMDGWQILQKEQRDKIDKGILVEKGEDNQQFNVSSIKEGCVDCGRVHVEMFELDQGAFDAFVKGLILKWQRWCMMAYDVVDT